MKLLYLVLLGLSFSMLHAMEDPRENESTTEQEDEFMAFITQGKEFKLEEKRENRTEENTNANLNTFTEAMKIKASKIKNINTNELMNCVAHNAVNLNTKNNIKKARAIQKNFTHDSFHWYDRYDD